MWVWQTFTFQWWWWPNPISNFWPHPVIQDCSWRSSRLIFDVLHDWLFSFACQFQSGGKWKVFRIVQVVSTRIILVICGGIVYYYRGFSSRRSSWDLIDQKRSLSTFTSDDKRVHAVPTKVVVTKRHHVNKMIHHFLSLKKSFLKT